MHVICKQQVEWHMTQSVELIKFLERNERKTKNSEPWKTVVALLLHPILNNLLLHTHIGLRHYKRGLSKNSPKKCFRQTFRKECQDWETGINISVHLRQHGLLTKIVHPSRGFSRFSMFTSFWKFKAWKKSNNNKKCVVFGSDISQLANKTYWSMREIHTSPNDDCKNPQAIVIGSTVKTCFFVHLPSLAHLYVWSHKPAQVKGQKWSKQKRVHAFYLIRELPEPG